MVTELNVTSEDSDTPQYFVFNHEMFISGDFSASVQILKCR